MKRTLMILIILAGPLLVVGCPETPIGTVLMDDEERLAWDRNFDGKADLLDDGVTPDLVLDPGIYLAANQADAIGPLVLTGLGAFGVPFVAVIAVFWKKYKLGKMIANLVASVQAGRASVEAQGAKGTLEILDNALANAQNPETAAMVADLKKAAGMPSVTLP